MEDFLQNSQLLAIHGTAALVHPWTSFVDVVNMSITASYVIIFVLIARLFLKKAPKIFSYSLWSVVLFRLIFPFTFSSAFSFLQLAGGNFGKMDYVPSNIEMMAQPQINTGINGVDSALPKKYINTGRHTLAITAR